MKLIRISAAFAIIVPLMFLSACDVRVVEQGHEHHHHHHPHHEVIIERR